MSGPRHTCGPTRTGVAACPACRAGIPVRRCGRCGQPVARPDDTQPDGQPSMYALWCAACIDRCHEALEFDHICHLCATPDEARRLGYRVAGVP